MQKLKAPQWDTPLTPAQIQAAEKRYGTLAVTFQALAGMIEEADGIFLDRRNWPPEDAESADVPAIKNDGRLLARDDSGRLNGDMAMLQSPATVAPVMRALLSAVNLRGDIERQIGPEAKTFYLNLKTALRYYRKPSQQNDCCASGEAVVGCVLAEGEDMVWAYMGVERKDGPTTRDLIGQIRRWEGATSIPAGKPPQWATAKELWPFTNLPNIDALRVALSRMEKDNPAIRRDIPKTGKRNPEKFVYESKKVLAKHGKTAAA
jgi:hypothetical protein